MEDRGMSALPARHLDLGDARSIKIGREILHSEATAINRLAQNLNGDFAEAVNTIVHATGSVIVTGMGKAGLIGKKIAASFSSTGTPSHFLHPAEAIHGDLGGVRPEDVVLLLSYSGETEEVTRLIPSLRRQASKLIAITSLATSTLGRGVDVRLLLGKIEEACTIGLAPSSTTTAMLALGDALVLVTSQTRGFTREHFARFHPGGALGRALTPVEQIMRPLRECRVAEQSRTLREVLVHVSRPGRRTGAIMLTDEQRVLTGVFTDSDLARLLENSGESQLDQPIANCMSTQVQTIQQGEMLPTAMAILAAKKISELPVVDPDGRPVGLIDITDVMSTLSSAWLKQETMPEAAKTAASTEEHSCTPKIFTLHGNGFH
jgi:arabinose-5-phosphate isomerase